MTQKLNMKQARSLLMLSLMLLAITTIVIVSASIRAPPYANAKVNYLAFENAIADASAEPGYGRAYLYGLVDIPPGIGGFGQAISKVKFNANPPPGNSPTTTFIPYVYAESYFHIKGSIDTDGAYAYIALETQVYVYKSNSWSYYDTAGYLVFHEGDYNEGHDVGGYVEINDPNVEKITVIPFIKTEVYGYCDGSITVCPHIQGVANFYINGYPYNYVYVPYIELSP